jgi:TolB-like protein
VRIVVELVDAAAQQTRWSEQYDRELADVLNVQSEVALRATLYRRSSRSWLSQV